MWGMFFTIKLFTCELLDRFFSTAADMPNIHFRKKNLKAIYVTHALWLVCKKKPNLTGRLKGPFCDTYVLGSYIIVARLLSDHTQFQYDDSHGRNASRQEYLNIFNRTIERRHENTLIISIWVKWNLILLIPGSETRAVPLNGDL